MIRNMDDIERDHYWYFKNPADDQLVFNNFINQKAFDDFKGKELTRGFMTLDFISLYKTTIPLVAGSSNFYFYEKDMAQLVAENGNTPMIMKTLFHGLINIILSEITLIFQMYLEQDRNRIDLQLNFKWDAYKDSVAYTMPFFITMPDNDWKTAKEIYHGH